MSLMLPWMLQNELVQFKQKALKYGMELMLVQHYTKNDIFQERFLDLNFFTFTMDLFTFTKARSKVTSVKI